MNLIRLAALPLADDQEDDMRLLVVEDDEKLAKILSTSLSVIGDVDIALSGEKALQDVEKTYYDLVILDLMLGKLSGMDVLREIRRTYLMPIIVLSALSDIDKKIDCFRLGADFSSTHYKFRNMEVNYVNKMMTVDGNYVPMNRKTYEILELLVRNKEIIMTKQQIFDRIWGYYSTTGTSVIEINIFRLRKILAEYGLDVCLKTIKATGYMWTEKV